MNSTNIFSATFFAAAKLCVFSFVFVNLPFSVKAHSANLPTQANNKLIDILANKQHAAHKKRQSLEQLTLTLAKQIKQLKNKNNSINSSQVNDLIETAKSRQILIAELLERSPKAVKRSKLPSNISKYAPDEIKQYLLQQQELAGELEVFYEDYEQVELRRLRHVLKTKAGRIELHFANTKLLSTLKHGSKVKVKGLFIENADAEGSTVALIESQAELVLLADDGNTVTTASVASAPLENTLGEQKTLVLLINFQDNPTEQPWTKAEVESMVFGTVNDYYQEASYGQTWLTGDVMGYYTLPITSTCDISDIHTNSHEIAINNGIDVNGYDRLIYIFPKSDACGWRGQGTVGGAPSRSWINGELNLLTIGHELGHNFGLKHAKELSCNRDYISENCIEITYGDVLDIMGKSEGHFNAFNKEKLGWLTPDRGEIVIADSDGSYMLEPYETVSAGVAKVLKIRRGTDTISGQPLWYYLEYRQPIGFDGFLTGKAITDGVLIHLNSNAEDINSSLLLDMTPHSSAYDLDDAALTAGLSYTDLDAGVIITTEWADQAAVSVNVVYSGQSCLKATPSLSLSPNESAWVEAGTAVAYSALVTNNDSVECPASSYDISAAVPTGWSSSKESLSLAAGANGIVTIMITSTIASNDGFYDIVFSAQNSAESNYSYSDTVSYVVDSPTEACVATNPLFILSIDDSGELLAGEQAIYRGTLTNQDSASCSAADFDISAAVPVGWTTENIVINLAPGQSSDVILHVLSANTAEEGIYDFIINAHKQLNSTYWSNAVASYTVHSPLPTCTLSAPSIVVANPQGREVVGGTQVNYSATITNKDSENCMEATFKVFAEIPAGWSTSNDQVTLAPGASTVVNIVVNSAAAATVGLYNFNIKAKNTAVAEFLGSAGITYAVKEVANTEPVAVDDSIIMPNKTSMVIDVIVNDWDAENDDLVIVSVTQGLKGRVQITSEGKVLYTPAKRFKSSDAFSYTITDGTETATAMVRISMSDVSGGKPNRNKK
ncbi:MAG: cadherin-like domain-containing protein [Colwellia sp.]|nr:cadherin-like domain-containing protein [Colwellia sp.]